MVRKDVSTDGISMEMHMRTIKAQNLTTPRLRACPIIRYFAKMNAYFPI